MRSPAMKPRRARPAGRLREQTLQSTPALGESRRVSALVMHSPPRILVVDDNETNRDILIARLGTHGYDLLQAADGEEAIEVAHSAQPDLILLDVMMPKLDGIEATRRLKADESLPFVPIILVTAKADSKDVETGLEAGADEYLTKPVDQISLVARVKSMLRVKELHEEDQKLTKRQQRYVLLQHLAIDDRRDPAWPSWYHPPHEISSD